MAKRVGCPVCSYPGVNYIMTAESIREYDEDLQMPVTIFFHYCCKTKMRVTGVVCMDCGGTGEYTTMEEVYNCSITSVKICPHCKGWGIIPRKFEIIPGDGPRPAGSRMFEKLFKDNRSE